MKKLFSVLSILAVLCAVSACGNDSGEASSTTTTVIESGSTAIDDASGLTPMETHEDDNLDWGDFEVME